MRFLKSKFKLEDSSDQTTTLFLILYLFIPNQLVRIEINVPIIHLY